MNFVPVVFVLAAINLSSDPTDYKTAFNRAQQDNKPLLILVTAEWCPPCRMLKQTTIPTMVEDNRFRDFHFALVDVDQEPKNARNLIGDGLVPQLIIYQKKEDGQWNTRSVMGFQSVTQLETFLEPSRPVRTAEADTLVVDQ